MEYESKESEWELEFEQAVTWLIQTIDFNVIFCAAFFFSSSSLDQIELHIAQLVGCLFAFVSIVSMFVATAPFSIARCSSNKTIQVVEKWNNKKKKNNPKTWSSGRRLRPARFHHLVNRNWSTVVMMMICLHYKYSPFKNHHFVKIDGWELRATLMSERESQQIQIEMLFQAIFHFRYCFHSTEFDQWYCNDRVKSPRQIRDQVQFTNSFETIFGLRRNYLHWSMPCVVDLTWFESARVYSSFHLFVVSCLASLRLISTRFEWSVFPFMSLILFGEFWLRFASNFDGIVLAISKKVCGTNAEVIDAFEQIL